MGKDDKIIFAWLATFFTIIGFLIAILLKKDDKYVMFYAKQGLILFIGQIIIWLLSGIFGWIKYPLWIFLAILWAMAWINALSGEQKNTWLIGDLAEKIKL
ncbi:MAG: hypothetical protein AABX80_01030, partial [Nanoarchaeota archaeon]